jgi:hypothetical protein
MAYPYDGSERKVEGVQKEISLAMAAIRRAAGSDLVIARSAVAEIESQTKRIVAVTGNLDVEKEGRYLVARAMGRLHDLDGKPGVVPRAGLQGAIGRFENALREWGFLPEPGE